jgi:hypothetical protein
MGHHSSTSQGKPLSFGRRIDPTHHMSTRPQQPRGQLLWCSDRRRKLIRLGLYQAPCSRSSLLRTSMRSSKPVNGARERRAASASPLKRADTEGSRFRSRENPLPRRCLPLRNAPLAYTPTPPWLLQSPIEGLGSRALECALESLKIRRGPWCTRPRQAQRDLLIPHFDIKTLFQGRRQRRLTHFTTLDAPPNATHKGCRGRRTHLTRFSPPSNEPTGLDTTPVCQDPRIVFLAYSPCSDHEHVNAERVGVLHAFTPSNALSHLSSSTDLTTWLKGNGSDLGREVSKYLFPVPHSTGLSLGGIAEALHMRAQGGQPGEGSPESRCGF